MKNKKKVIATASAVALAAALLFGGTMAYFYDESEEVVNTIAANYNSVDLYEDIDSDGETEQENSYEIVPGTSAVKNPTVSVNYTLDSYVFITMDEDVEGLVEFSIDTSVWTQLDGYDNVWYRLVTTDDVNGEEISGSSASLYKQTLNVLTDGVITYSRYLTNDEMLEDGSLIRDMTMIFQAYIMQADPFLSGNDYDEETGAVAAYLAMLGDADAYAEAGVAAMVNGKLYTELSEAVSAALVDGANTTIEVVADTEISEVLLLSLNEGETASITLDLNGNTITYVSNDDTNSIDEAQALIKVTDGVTLTITGDGAIDGTGMADSDTEHELIYARGGNVIIESGSFLLNSTEGSVVCARKTDDGSADVTIYGGTFKNNAENYAYNSSLEALTLNLVNGNPGTITVYGGTFYGNDPANGDDDLGGSFVAEGYTSVKVSGDEDPAVYKVVGSETAVTASSTVELDAILSKVSEESYEEVTIELDEDTYNLTALDNDIPEGTTITGAGTDETTLTVNCNSTTGDGYTISSENVTLCNLTVNCNNMGTSYANAAINITASGVVLDNVVITGGTRATYTASIYINGGSDEDFTFTLKNSTIENANGAPFRALFVEGLAGTLYIEDCTLDSVYPMNIMSALTTAEVYFTDCTIHGWTSYTSNVNKVIFTNCTFSKGSDSVNTYDNVAAYTDTVFDGCTFDENFVVNAQTTGFTWTFTNCTKNGISITAENFKTLFSTDSNVWTRCTCTVNSTAVTNQDSISD